MSRHVPRRLYRLRTCVTIFLSKATATTAIYTLSLHDALPISRGGRPRRRAGRFGGRPFRFGRRSEEHTSELQSHHDLVCRLLLEKKKIGDELTAPHSILQVDDHLKVGLGQ